MDAYAEQPQPWIHQGEGVSLLLRGSGALWLDPRLGKTRTELEAARIHNGMGVIDRAIFIGSVNALEEWLKALAIFMPHWPVEVLRGLNPHPLASSTRAVVLNPDILDVSVRRGTTYHGWLGTLLKWCGPNMLLVLDECHKYVSNPRSKEYKAIEQLARVARMVHELTGTYYESSALDAHHALRLLGPRYPMRWKSDQAFAEVYCDKTPILGGGQLAKGKRKDGTPYEYRRPAFKYTGLKDGMEDQLMAVLEGVVLRRRRDECLDVPMTRIMARWVDHYDQDVMLRRDEMERLRSELILLKAQRTIEYVNELRERPIIIYAWHRKMLAHLANHFRAPLIMGDTSRARRVAIGEEFQAGRHPILVATLAMDAVDLSAADHDVYAEIDWRATYMRQSMDRKVNGNKQRETVSHVLLVSGSVEEEIWDRVLMKGQAIERLDQAAKRLRELGLDMAELSS